MSATTDLKRLLKLTGSIPLDKPYLKAVELEYKQVIKDINKQIQKVYLKYGDDVPIEKMYQYNRLKVLKSQILDTLNESYKRVKKITMSSIKESLTEGYGLTSYSYSEMLGGFNAGINFGLLNPNVITASVVNPLDKVTGYLYKSKSANGSWIWDNSLKTNHAKSLQRISSAVTQGLIKGDGYLKTSRNIKKSLFGKKGNYNLTKAVQRIVSTESGKARSLAGVLSYDKLRASSEKIGIGVKRLWLNALDNRSRHHHLALHNTPENENRQWIVGGHPADAPQLTGVASEDIECRCDATTEVDGLESTYDETKVAKKLDPEKYKIWKGTQK